MITNGLENDANQIVCYYNSKIENIIKIITPTDLFLIMKDSNFYPIVDDKEIMTSQLSYNIKAILSGLCTKKTSLKLFGLGILFYISSYFIPMRRYYIISAIVVFLISLFGLTISLFSQQKI